MTVFARSAKATLIAIPALLLLYLVVFPPSFKQPETLFWMLLAVVLCGIPLLVCIFLFNLVFNTRLGARSPVWSMAIGAAIAGVGSAFISGIIGEVWAIFVIMGGIIGYIAGATR